MTADVTKVEEFRARLDALTAQINEHGGEFTQIEDDAG